MSFPYFHLKLHKKKTFTFLPKRITKLIYKTKFEQKKKL